MTAYGVGCVWRACVLRWLIRPIGDRHTRPQSVQVFSAGFLVGCCCGVIFRFMRRRDISLSRFNSRAFRPRRVASRHESRSAAKASRSCGLISQSFKVLRTLSRYLLEGAPTALVPRESSPYSSCLGRRSSDIRITWPSHRSCDWCMMVSIVRDLVLSRTVVFGTLSLHVILSSRRRQVIWNLSMTL